MQLARAKSKRPLRKRIHARGAIVRKDRRRQCAAMSTNCHPEHHPKQRSCTWLGIISKDPIGFAAGDANLYRYVGNDPVNSIDPDGRKVYDGPSVDQKTGLRYVDVYDGWSWFATPIGRIIYDGEIVSDEQVFQLAETKSAAGSEFGALVLYQNSKTSRSGLERFQSTGLGSLLG
jgi:hypothetical protein